MDYKELFTTPEFRAYEEAMAECVAGFLHDKIMRADNPNSVALKDAIELAQTVLRLPRHLVRDDEFATRLDDRIKDLLLQIPKRVLLREMYD